MKKTIILILTFLSSIGVALAVYLPNYTRAETRAETMSFGWKFASIFIKDYGLLLLGLIVFWYVEYKWLKIRERIENMRRRV